jgi:hypothetical protein
MASASAAINKIFGRSVEADRVADLGRAVPLRVGDVIVPSVGAGRGTVSLAARSDIVTERSG